MFFFRIVLFKSAWLTAALDTPIALPASVKLIYSDFLLVLMFVTVTLFLFAAVAFFLDIALIYLT